MSTVQEKQKCTMRSEQIRNQYVLPYLNGHGNDITYILRHISGGWESWLQVGLGLAMAQDINVSFSTAARLAGDMDKILGLNNQFRIQNVIIGLQDQNAKIRL